MPWLGRSLALTSSDFFVWKKYVFLVQIQSSSQLKNRTEKVIAAVSTENLENLWTI